MMAEEFFGIIEHISGPAMDYDEVWFFKKFHEWAASWDCNEAEATQEYLRGDEIGVGALWEDKSQKDFKSYL
jgi:hypothetical protein